jgi:hypothetical protein
MLLTKYKKHFTFLYFDMKNNILSYFQQKTDLIIHLTLGIHFHLETALRLDHKLDHYQTAGH